MKFTFLQPLFLFLLFFPAIFIYLKIHSYKKSHFDIKNHIFRIAVCLFLIIGVSMPNIVIKQNDSALAFGIDVSNSIDLAQIVESVRWINNLDINSDKKRFFFFADNVSQIEKVNKDSLSNVLANLDLDYNETNFQEVLTQMLNYLKYHEGDKKAYIFSDGNQTLGDYNRIIYKYNELGIPVYTYPMSMAEKDRLLIESINIPKTIYEKQKITSKISLYSPLDGEIFVEIKTKNFAKSDNYKIEKGKNNLSIDIDGLAVEDKEIKFNFKFNNQDQSFSEEKKITVKILPAKKVLVFQKENKDIMSFFNKNFEYKFNSVDNFDSIENSKLDSYSFIIFNNLPYEKLNINLIQLKDYVSNGGGLLFISGDKVFGEGGYSQSEFEEILPVQFEMRERKKNLALVIAIDRSYSMKGEKIEYAKEAARSALGLLEEQHLMGVVAFDSRPYVSVPLKMVRSKKRAEEKISRIQASGQTNIYPALGIVHRMLKDLKDTSKHVILLSDGDTHGADFKMMVDRMRTTGITLSTVTIGEDGDPDLMNDLSVWGGGRNYKASSAEAIPEIFIEETNKALNLKDDLINEFQISENLKFDAIENFNEFPKLSNYSIAKKKKNSEVLLYVNKSYPFLSRWNYGLGNVNYLGVDIEGKWSKDLIDSDFFSDFLNKLFYLSESQIKDDRFNFSFNSYKANDFEITFKILNPTPERLMQNEINFNVVDSNNNHSQYSAIRSFGNLYKANISRGDYGNFIELKSKKDFDGYDSTFLFTMTNNKVQEMSFYKVNEVVLQQIASKASGEFMKKNSEFNSDKIFWFRQINLAPFFLIVALLVFFLEIIFRKKIY